MAGTSLGTLVQQTRRFLRDWADWDALTAALTDTVGTTVTVADTTRYAVNWPVEVDQETMMIRAKPSGTTLTVERGAFGSTAATHASGAPVLVRPNFYAVEIIDALNEAIYATWPWLYKPVMDTTLTTLSNTYEYTVPNMPGTYRGRTIPIPRLYEVQILQAGDIPYRKVSRWTVERGATPLLKFRSPEPAGGTIRVKGFGPFTDITAVASTVDAQYPPEAEYILPIYAAGSLLLSGEAGRVRVDTGAVDAREQANRVGASAQIGQMLLSRFQGELRSCALPPLPKHTKRVI